MLSVQSVVIHKLHDQMLPQGCVKACWCSNMLDFHCPSGLPLLHQPTTNILKHILSLPTERMNCCYKDVLFVGSLLWCCWEYNHLNSFNREAQLSIMSYFCFCIVCQVPLLFLSFSSRSVSVHFCLSSPVLQFSVKFRFCFQISVCSYFCFCFLSKFYIWF